MTCSAVADVIKNDYLCRRMDSCPILTWCKGVRGRSDSGHLFYRSFTYVLHCAKVGTGMTIVSH